MTPLRQRMIQDMALRNLSPGTQAAYIRAVVGLSDYYSKRAPQTLSREEVRRYLVHLVQERKLSWGHYNQIRCGLLFFFGVTPGREDADVGVPYPRQPKRLPMVLPAVPARGAGLERCRCLLDHATDSDPPHPTHLSLVPFEMPDDLCPLCGRGHMIKRQLLPRQPNLLLLKVPCDTS